MVWDSIRTDTGYLSLTLRREAIFPQPPGSNTTFFETLDQLDDLPRLCSFATIALGNTTISDNSTNLKWRYNWIDFHFWNKPEFVEFADVFGHAYHWDGTTLEEMTSSVVSTPTSSAVVTTTTTVPLVSTTTTNAVEATTDQPTGTTSSDTPGSGSSSHRADSRIHTSLTSSSSTADEGGDPPAASAEGAATTTTATTIPSASATPGQGGTAHPITTTPAPPETHGVSDRDDISHHNHASTGGSSGSSLAEEARSFGRASESSGLSVESRENPTNSIHPTTSDMEFTTKAGEAELATTTTATEVATSTIVSPPPSTTKGPTISITSVSSVSTDGQSPSSTSVSSSVEEMTVRAAAADAEVNDLSPLAIGLIVAGGAILLLGVAGASFFLLRRGGRRPSIKEDLMQEGGDEVMGEGPLLTAPSTVTSNPL